MPRAVRNPVSRPQAGAAQVSLMWVIVMAVLLVFAGIFAYASLDKSAALQEELDASRAEVQSWQSQVADLNRQLTALSLKIGFTDGASDTHVSPEAIALDTFKAVFPSAASAPNVQELLNAAVTDYNALSTRLQNARNEITELRNTLNEREDELTQLTREKDSQIADLRRDLEDTRTQLNNQIVDVERERDALRDTVRELNTRVSDQTAQIAELTQQYEKALQDLQLRAAVLGDRLNHVERRAATPDGTVLSSSSAVGKAWIDLGRRNRLRSGMEFEVKDPLSGEYKGRLRVDQVEEKRSSCSILEEVDRYDPIGPDDLLFNEIYDPSRTMVAVLLGNGFGRYSENDMKTMLAEVGVETRGEVSNEVDILILGTPFFDPDTGEVLPWSSQDAYKAAESLGVVVVPFRDAMAWLGL